MNRLNNFTLKSRDYIADCAMKADNEIEARPRLLLLKTGGNSIGLGPQVEVSGVVADKEVYYSLGAGALLEALRDYCLKVSAQSKWHSDSIDSGSSLSENLNEARVPSWPTTI